MNSIVVDRLGKAYKHYRSQWLRALEHFLPWSVSRHQQKWVLKELSFTIRQGEAVGIVGVNGAGKSTLLKMLTGTTRPTEGSVQINGRVAALLELGIGFHPDFTGRQNVFMSGLMMGLTRHQLTQLMPEIAAFADIGDYLEQPVRIYSSGMQMRLAFAVATAIRPDILIVDEALCVGDSRFQAKCFARIAEFKKAGTTLLLVSHSAEDIVKHCDRALFLKNGRLELDGPSREVTNRYLDELFGKSKIVPPVLPATPEDNQKEGIFAALNNRQDIFHTRGGYRPEEYRWGQGGAKIIDYEIKVENHSYPAHIQSNQTVHVYFKVYFEEDFAQTVAGILVKAIDGVFLYGTNSYLASEQQTILSVSQGECKIFKFSFPLQFNHGDYLLSLGISSGHPAAELIPLDRRYDAILLHVVKEREFWGIVDLQSTFEFYD